MKPTPQLQGLIAQATPEQAARAIGYARRHLAACRALGVDPGSIERIVTECFEIVLKERAGKESKDSTDDYTARNYRSFYREE